MTPDDDVGRKLSKRFAESDRLVPEGPPWADVLDTAHASSAKRSNRPVIAFAASIAAVVVLGLLTINRQTAPIAGTEVSSASLDSADTTPAMSPEASPTTRSVDASWRRLGRAPLDGRVGHSAVWSGEEMIVWGGYASKTAGGTLTFSDVADGAAYDPVFDRWRSIAEGPLQPRSDHGAVWTGQEMIVWGGGHWNDGSLFEDGAAYDPRSDTWRPLPASPLPATTDPILVWSGSQVVVIDRRTGQTAVYDPSADEWTMAPSSALPPGWRTAAWLDSSLFVAAYGDGSDTPIEAATLDLTKRSWAPVATSPKSARRMAEALAAGTEALLMSRVDATLPSGLAPSAGYNAATKEWRKLGCGVPSSDAAWTGDVVVAATGLYDPRTDTCESVPDPPLPDATTPSPLRESSSTIWSGSELIVWGGATGGDGAPFLNDGIALSLKP